MHLVAYYIRLKCWIMWLPPLRGLQMENAFVLVPLILSGCATALEYVPGNLVVNFFVYL
jgi:hypothetical protein